MPSISRCINILSRASGMFRLANFEDGELRPYLHGYILALTRTPGLSQEQIARRLCANKSSVARALAALENMGYVERRRDEKDRRLTLVFPTEKAINSRERIRAAFGAWNEYINGAFTKEEAEQFLILLEKAAKRAAEYAKEELDGVDFSEDGGGEDK